MELTGSRTIPAPQQATWDALDDPATLKACIAGCESLERTDDGALAAVVAMRVGPVAARFKGRLVRSEVDAPNGCTMAFDGQGGVAGFGRGSAVVRLAPVAGGHATVLSYDAKATVGGKLAQIGSRLVDAAASKVADDFFAAFEALMRDRHAPVVAATATVSGSATPAGPTTAVGVPDPYLRPPSPRVTPPARQPGQTSDWVLAALVIVATVWFVMR